MNGYSEGTGQGGVRTGSCNDLSMMVSNKGALRSQLRIKLDRAGCTVKNKRQAIRKYNLFDRKPIYFLFQKNAFEIDSSFHTLLSFSLFSCTLRIPKCSSLSLAPMTSLVCLTSNSIPWTYLSVLLLNIFWTVSNPVLLALPRTMYCCILWTLSSFTTTLNSCSHVRAYLTYPNQINHWCGLCSMRPPHISHHMLQMFWLISGDVCIQRYCQLCWEGRCYCGQKWRGILRRFWWVQTLSRLILAHLNFADVKTAFYVLEHSGRCHHCRQVFPDQHLSSLCSNLWVSSHLWAFSSTNPREIGGLVIWWNLLTMRQTVVAKEKQPQSFEICK